MPVQVLETPPLQRLRKVKLKAPPALSRFWRYHSEGEGHLSSLEALYYMLQEYQAASGKTMTEGRLEDIFFLFRLQLRMIKVRSSFLRA